MSSDVSRRETRHTRRLSAGSGWFKAEACGIKRVDTMPQRVGAQIASLIEERLRPSDLSGLATPLWVRLQEALNHQRPLLLCEGTHRVDQQPARPHLSCGLIEDLTLKLIVPGQI